ncbi:MAG: double-cubane-cluster-containing anaerobic reductase [Armatimonadota bacterium]
MSGCCGNNKNIHKESCDPCNPPSALPCSTGHISSAPLAWFDNMIDNCLDYAEKTKSEGRPVVGIMCEYAPRELIMAAGGVPVCLCGGSAATIPAAEETLPSNLCPLIKSTFGYHTLGSNPFLEMADLIIAETTCDGKKKMFELMAETRPTYIMELPQKQDDADAFEHWVLELKKLIFELEKRFNVEITDKKIREAIDLMNHERALRLRLAELMKLDSPPITGRQLLELKSTISGIPADLEQYEKAVKLYEGQSGNGDRSSRVRVLLTGVPVVHGAERVIDIIEDHGGLIVCAENCTGLKPILENVDADADDPVRALAAKYFNLHCSVMTKNNRRIDAIRDIARQYRAECIIDLAWQACITYSIESYRVKQLAENELHVPFLRIETDYSPSDSARIAVRVEALFETVKNACTAPSCCGD